MMRLQPTIYRSPTDTRKISWCSFEDPESEITSVAVCGETLVFFDAKTGCILKETREAQNTEIKELLCIDSKKVQLYAVSENEVVADDLESGKVFEIDVNETLPERSIILIHDTEYPQSIASKAFQKFLAERKEQNR